MSKPSAHQSNTIASLLTYLAIALPCVIYLWVVNYYAVDVPVWDDYVNPLDMTNKAITAETLGEKLAFLAQPMNGHLPFFPRVLLYLQYLAGVTAAIKTALLISNLGWVAATLLLIVYCHRGYRIPLPWLIPIPFLLLSLAHWEAMDFYSSAFQMYWGSGLFAIAGLIAIVHNRTIFASLCFLAGIFSSGGALAAYPVCLVFLVLTKRWKQGVIFLLCTIPSYLLYTHINPPQNQLHQFPNILLLAQYILNFTGNLLSTGQWDLSAYAILHRVIGGVLILAMIYFSWMVKGHHAVKLIFFYTVMIGAMAGYMRMDLHIYAVSRYAMYALLAAACTYILLVVPASSADKKTNARTVIVVIAGVLSVGLWLHSLWVCRAPLMQNHEQRVTHMRGYIDTGSLEVLSTITWNVEHAVGVLEHSRAIGLYDYQHALDP